MPKEAGFDKGRPTRFDTWHKRNAFSITEDLHG